MKKKLKKSKISRSTLNKKLLFKHHIKKATKDATAGLRMYTLMRNNNKNVNGVQESDLQDTDQIYPDIWICRITF